MIKLEKGKNMKTTYTHILLICLLALGAMQAKALNYQNTYQPSTYDMPQVAFRSTSAYSSQWTEQDNTMLNSDGSVNEEAYTTSRNNAPGGPRRIINPDEEDEDDKENGTPLGDVLFPLMLMALAYIVIRLYRRRKA